MSGLVSASRKVVVYVDGKKYDEEVISGQISHDSSYTSSIITCKGQVVLGNGAPIDIAGTKFTPGESVNINADYGRGKFSRVPLGGLFVLSSYADPGNLTTTLDVGCSLAFARQRENIFTDAAKNLIKTHISRRILDAFDIDEYNFSTLESLLRIEGKVMFQTNLGVIKTVEAFSSSTSSKFTSIDNGTAISLGSLSGAIEDSPGTLQLNQDFKIEIEEGRVRQVGTQVSIYPSVKNVREGTNPGGTTDINYYLTRTGIKQIACSVEWTASGTVDEDDFPGFLLEMPSGTISFAAGQTTARLTLSIAADDDIESKETLTVRLSDPVDCTIGISSATVEIINDDEEEPDEDDIPPDEDEEDDDDPIDPIVNPFITSVLQRTIDCPDITDGQTLIIENKTSGEGAVEGVPTCGTIEEPGEPAEAKFAFTVTGNMEQGVKSLNEEVTSGQYITYTGTGNQVDREITFEYCSAITYGGGLISTVLNKYVAVYNQERERANALLSKANQYFALADDYQSRDLTGLSASQITFINNAIEYYGCAASQLYSAAEGIVGGANVLFNEAINFVDEYESIYGVANINVTENIYDSNGVITKKVVSVYNHKSATNAASTAAENVKEAYVFSPNLDTYRYQYLIGLNFAAVSNAVGTSFDNLLDGCLLPVESNFSNTTEAFSVTAARFNNEIISKTTTTYEYGDVFNTETQVFEDLQNPKNNTKKVSRSSNNSAREEDRLVLEETVDGDTLSGEDEPLTDEELEELEELEEEERERVEQQIRDDKRLRYRESKKEVEVERPVEIKTEETTESSELDLGSVNAVSTIPPPAAEIPNSWFGRIKPAVKKITMPLEFKGFTKHRQISGNDLDYYYKDEVNGNPARIIATYQSIAQQFLENEAKRLTSDRSGIRVTETLRSELCDYYPFYPVKVDLTNTSKTSFRGKSNVCNVVFDNNNVLVSLDLYGTGSTKPRLGGSSVVAISTSVLASSSLSEGTTTLGSDYFNVPANVNSISVQTLPSQGTVTNNGVAVGIGDTITAAQIANGDVVYTPASPTDTEAVEISFTGTKSDGTLFDIVSDLFPHFHYDGSAIPNVDAGDFDNTTSNGGNDVDAGFFTTKIGIAGGFSPDGGNFDTGTVDEHEPTFLASEVVAHDTADPENDMGTTLVDGNDTVIDVDALPQPVGTNVTLLSKHVYFKLNVGTGIFITASIFPQKGWNYGRIPRTFGTEIDFGSVATPNTFNADFGSVTTPATPTLASYVV